LNALVFVVIAIIGAMARVSAEKARHFVLVKPLDANVSILGLVVIIKFAGFAGRARIFLKF
jgi:hypothetical protein